MDEGFTYSYRKKWQNPVFRNLLEAGIWAWMCDTAAWKDTRVRFNGEVHELKRGQIVTSRRFIAEAFCIGEQVTRTFLENLENDQMINQQPTHKATIITICKYDEYQIKENTANPQANHDLTHSQPTANPPIKEKEVKEGKEVSKKEEVAPLPEWLPLLEWEAFKVMRRKIKKPLTAHAEKLAIGKLDEFRSRGHDPTLVLNYSTMNDYPGIYEPKGNDHAKRKRTYGEFEKQDYSLGTEGFDVINAPNPRTERADDLFETRGANREGVQAIRP